MKKKKEKIEKAGVVSGLIKKITRPVSDKLYDASVAIHRALPHKKMSGKRKRIGETIFYWAVLAIPLIQFAIMYVAVNIDSILFAFQSYYRNPQTAEVTVDWVGFDNFKLFIQEITSNQLMIQRLKNSLIVYAVALFVGTVLAILFAYYIYKGYAGSGAFRVILMLPSILSSVVLVLIFKFMVQYAFPAMFGIGDLLGGSATSKFWTVVIYNTFMGFGSGMLMYSNAMGRIPDSLTEYAKLEGCSPVREFFSITLPLIYPTVQTFLIIGLAGIFTDQANLFTFFSESAPQQTQTIGYYLYNTVFTQRSDMTSYPYAAAAGLTLTAVTIPIVMIARFLLNKLDKGAEM